MLNTIDLFTILRIKYKECDFSFMPINQLGIKEKIYFSDFMPNAKTVIIIYYHVENLKDWIWNCPNGNLENERCNIDDATKDICNYIKQILEQWEYNTEIVPYPGQSGLQFRNVSIAAGFGEIGKNAFYLHPKWGAKVHLRVLLSEIESDFLCSIKYESKRVCLNCGECIKNCPANAFENGFNGLKCREYRKNHGEYIPYGKNGTLRYCRKCITVCKAGYKY
jgi:epoxyqueuosine reductase